MKIIGYIFWLTLLTVLTQVGGIILLLCIPIFVRINKNQSKRIKRWLLKSLSFVLIYVSLSFALVPTLARYTGRTLLPIWGNSQIKPLTIWTYLLNRHYVDPELLDILEDVSQEIQYKHPNTALSYLDANFPFIDGFPLIPHLSHNDGKKLDLAFFYLDSKTNSPLPNSSPSVIGYGVYESPRIGDQNTAKECDQQGYWQYGFMENVIPQWRKDEMILDEKRTRDLISLFVQKEKLGKVFLEPHLKKRMKLNHPKIRFHGCWAVRHDDHIHIQMN